MYVVIATFILGRTFRYETTFRVRNFAIVSFSILPPTKILFNKKFYSFEENNS
jgi:hypothetical protein